MHSVFSASVSNDARMPATAVAKSVVAAVVATVAAVGTIPTSQGFLIDVGCDGSHAAVAEGHQESLGMSSLTGTEKDRRTNSNREVMVGPQLGQKHRLTEPIRDAAQRHLGTDELDVSNVGTRPPVRCVEPSRFITATLKDRRELDADRRVAGRADGIPIVVSAVVPRTQLDVGSDGDRPRCDGIRR